LASFQAGKKEAGRYIYPFIWFGGRIGPALKLPKLNPFKKTEERPEESVFLADWFLFLKEN
jgi:hypothetical protein